MQHLVRLQGAIQEMCNFFGSLVPLLVQLVRIHVATRAEEGLSACVLAGEVGEGLVRKPDGTPWALEMHVKPEDVLASL